jgi:hypothetical protein
LPRKDPLYFFHLDCIHAFLLFLLDSLSIGFIMSGIELHDRILLSRTPLVTLSVTKSDTK